MYLELKSKPNLARRLTIDEAVPGLKVDLVPMSGTMSTSCLATRAATGAIIDATECDNPQGVTPRKVKAGRGCVVVEFDSIWSPLLKLPDYKVASGDAAALMQFEKRRAVVPLRMLREFVEGATVRATPVNMPHDPVALPVPLSGLSKDQSPFKDEEKEAADSAAQGLSSMQNDADVDEFVLTPADIEQIQAAVQKMTTTQTQVEESSGVACNDDPTPKAGSSSILSCSGLSPAPSPESIRDNFSAVLGDPFHAIDRTKVPVKHEAKKAFFVALREAFFVWNTAKLEEFEGLLREKGWSDKEIENARFYSSEMFRACVDRVVPPPSVLYWRVRAVYVLYGRMIDSKTGKKLFNDKVWTKADNVLKEILTGYYSDPPGIEWYTPRLDDEGDD